MPYQTWSLFYSLMLFDFISRLLASEVWSTKNKSKYRRLFGMCVGEFRAYRWMVHKKLQIVRDKREGPKVATGALKLFVNAALVTNACLRMFVRRIKIGALDLFLLDIFPSVFCWASWKWSCRSLRNSCVLYIYNLILYDDGGLWWSFRATATRSSISQNIELSEKSDFVRNECKARWKGKCLNS